MFGLTVEVMTFRKETAEERIVVTLVINYKQEGLIQLLNFLFGPNHLITMKIHSETVCR